MYSVVLMMALTNAPAEVPAWGRRGCHGCWGCSGGCYGGGCYGGWGGCYGGGCYGGGWGGCYGGYARGGYGCYGGGCYGCYGGYGCGGYAGVGYYGGPTTYAPVYAAYQPMLSGGTQAVASGGEKSVPATIVVSLPADAKLTVDNTPTKETASPRKFVTPPLAPGRTYYYTLKGEIVRDGRTLTAMKRVTFTAGQEAKVTLDFDQDTVAQK